MSSILLLIVTVPVITALIGWVTNWAAVKMIFHPTGFIGVGPLGWQGIIYKQGHKFAANVADMATRNLLSAEELVKRIDLDEIDAMFAATFEEEVAELCRRGAEILQPGAWDRLPEPARTVIITQVGERSRVILRELFLEIEKNAGEYIDLHTLVYQQLSGANVSRLAEFTQRIGHREFKFIEWYGGVFGFLIGLAQIGIWSYMQRWWLMPVVGVIVGLVTNWLAIEMIFRPHEPRKYLGFIPYQGLFPKRQGEIAADYGKVAGEELLTPKNLIEFLTTGPGSARVLAFIKQTLSERIDEEWKKVQPMVPIQVTDEKLAELEKLVAGHLLAGAPRVRPRLEQHLARKMQVRETVEGRLASLPKPDFERVLRGIFEEDEITLIVVGGVLGGLVGIVQAVLVLATQG